MPDANVTVIPVRSRADSHRFIGLPYRLYENDPMWVAPLKRAEKQFWNPAHNAALKARRVERYIALRNNCCIGRIAAVMDSEFARRWSPHTGFFGFFECIDDWEVAWQLLRVAETRLQQWDALSVYGPVNLSTQHEVGFMLREGEP